MMQIVSILRMIFLLQDELARVFVTLFDAKHLLYQLLWNMFSKEVEIADCMQTLFRGNSLASKIMAFCFKIYGQGYLRELLHPLIMDMFEADKMGVSYEVDTARYVSYNMRIVLFVVVIVINVL